MRRACLAILLISATARAQPAGGTTSSDATAVVLGPQRVGFTIEIDGGVGVTHTTGTIDGPRTRPAVGGLDIGIGGFVTPDLALLFRFAAQTFYIPQLTTNKIAAHAFAGPAIEWWLDDRFFAGAGVGLGVEGSQDQDGNNADNAIGLGATARGGYAVTVNEDSGWRVTLEANYGMLNNRRAYSGALLIGWQSF